MQSNCYHARIVISSPSLQSTTVSVHLMNHTQKGVNGKFNTVVQLNPLSRADLSWWLSLDRKFLSNSIVPTVPSVTIESDASSKGWGAVLNGQTQTGGVWSTEERKQLPGTADSISSSPSIWEELDEHNNSSPSVTCINQKGGTTSILLCQLAITVWTWCNITLTAEHLLGHLNTIVDQESWSVRDCCDWMLNPSVFQRIKRPLEVDLFASCLTKQLPLFYSWRADPEAAATDAFMQDWSQQRGYAIPPCA